MRHADHDVVLCEKYPVLAEMWRYLIGASADEIMRIPDVEHVDDLPGWVPEGGKILVGFAMNSATVSPCKRLSAGRKRLAEAGRKFEGWNSAYRNSVAHGVQCIKHWRLFEGSFEELGNGAATWFIDPPYSNHAGSYYVYSDIDFIRLGRWCQDRIGQVIVCENVGAQWLPFEPFKAFHSTMGRPQSQEALWYRESSVKEI